MPLIYKNVLPSGENYNKMLWILDNMWIPQSRNNNELTEDDKMLLNNYFVKINSYLGTNLSISSFRGNGMTDSELMDIMEVINQTAIWNFTNYGNDGTSINSKFYLRNGNNSIQARDINEKYYNGNSNSPIDSVYRYLISNANSHSNYNSGNLKIKIDGSNAKSQILSDEYLVGPYYSVGSGNISNIKVLDENGNEISSKIKLLRSDTSTLINGNNLKEKIESIGSSAFYIKISKSYSDINFVVKCASRKLKFLSTEQSEATTTQPVALIEESINTSYDNQKLTNSNFDLAIRQFATKINNRDVIENNIYKREPQISQENINNFVHGNSKDGVKSTSILKNQIKDGLEVRTGDVITISIRVYNEGGVNGKVTEITDYLQDGLELNQNSNINNSNGWQVDYANKKKVVTNSSRNSILNNKTLKAYNKNLVNEKYPDVDYVDIQIELKVTANLTSTDQFIKNIIEISKATGEDGSSQVDRDSTENNIKDEQIKFYEPGTSSVGQGYEDDDDYENFVLKGSYFDLAIREFVSKVNDTELKDGDRYKREPNVDLTKLIDGSSTTAEYKGLKEPVSIASGDTIIFNIRVYNEGNILGFANEIVDYLPNEFEFINDDFNAAYGWTLFENDVTQRKLKTSIISSGDDTNQIKAFDGQNLSYKEIRLKVKVKNDSKPLKALTNLVEITKSSNSSNMADRDDEKSLILPDDDNLPNYKGNNSNKDELGDLNYYYQGQEDDDDFENVIIQEFDLALRTFISKINNTEIIDRVPILDKNSFGTIVDDKKVTTFTYNQKKDHVQVEDNDIVTFSIRVYNEGTQDGYTKIIQENIPYGLQFLPKSQNNVDYKWKLYDDKNNETDDITKATKVKTEYLSKEEETIENKNLLKAYNTKENGGMPMYAEVKIDFKVFEPSSKDRIIRSNFEIGDDEDTSKNPVTDIDSTPNNWTNNDDDQDTEFLYVKVFDLSLKQYIKKAIIIEDGVERILNTGYTANDNPKKTLKDEIKKGKEKNTIVKFVYDIVVKNDGEIAGNCYELTDYVPTGLTFNQADNLQWNEFGNKIYSRQLEETEIQPNSEQNVELTLTWDNDSQNMKLMSNVVEISESFNKSYTPDIDSTPNNMKNDEDDIDYAESIVTEETGKNLIATIVVSLGFLIIILVGTILIKKYI